MTDLSFLQGFGSGSLLTLALVLAFIRRRRRSPTVKHDQPRCIPKPPNY